MVYGSIDRLLVWLFGSIFGPLERAGKRTGEGTHLRYARVVIRLLRPLQVEQRHFFVISRGEAFQLESEKARDTLDFTVAATATDAAAGASASASAAAAPVEYEANETHTNHSWTGFIHLQSNENAALEDGWLVDEEAFPPPGQLSG